MYDNSDRVPDVDRQASIMASVVVKGFIEKGYLKPDEVGWGQQLGDIISITTSTFHASWNHSRQSKLQAIKLEIASATDMSLLNAVVEDIKALPKTNAELEQLQALWKDQYLQLRLP